MRLFVVASLICLITFAAMPQDKRSSWRFVSQTPVIKHWERYTVKGEEFSATLPALPAMRTQKTLVAALTTRIERILGSYDEGVAYAIHSYENVLNESLNDLIGQSKSRRSRSRKWTDQREINVNEFKGKQFTISEADVLGVAQFFRTKDHLYWFEAMGAPADDPRIERFFSSVSLGEKVNGAEVRDGVGARPQAIIDQSKLFVGRDVDQKVVILTKPEPSYTEEARQAGTTGTVVIKAIFASNGVVTNIRTTQGLPFGLTEQAIYTARQIKFVPAMKDGKYVSMWIQLEYNFNLY